MRSYRTPAAAPTAGTPSYPAERGVSCYCGALGWILRRPGGLCVGEFAAGRQAFPAPIDRRRLQGTYMGARKHKARRVRLG